MQFLIKFAHTSPDSITVQDFPGDSSNIIEAENASFIPNVGDAWVMTSAGKKTMYKVEARTFCYGVTSPDAPTDEAVCFVAIVLTNIPLEEMGAWISSGFANKLGIIGTEEEKGSDQ